MKDIDKKMSFIYSGKKNRRSDLCWKSLLFKSCILISLLVPILMLKASERPAFQQEQLKINRIKSAYLFNFLKYVTFDHGEETLNPNEYSVCVLGVDPLGSALDAMSGRKAKRVNVVVKRLQNIEQAKGCHIIYISDSEKENIEVILKELNKYSRLTVSDINGFTRMGGVIGFISEGGKIRIEINLTNARQANIRISALLLEIARIID